MNYPYGLIILKMRSSMLDKDKFVYI